MRDLLARRNGGALARLARSRTLLAFDFDGTLSPIAARRDAAAMRRETAELLARVCELYPCAVLSGRARADVASRLGTAAVKYVIGNHGLEPGPGLAPIAKQMRVARRALAEALRSEPGVELEDKRYSLSLHYRRSPRKREARAKILAAISTLTVRTRVVPGKLIVNVVSEGAPNKGTALLALLARERADASLYVGDDVTDEDVFELPEPGRLLTVRVGRSRSSAASHYIKGQRSIDRLLSRLITERTKG